MILGHFIVIAILGTSLTRTIAHALVSSTFEGYHVLDINFTMMVAIDIDECSIQVDECDHNCNNTLGSYTCSCNDGYILDRNGLQQCNGKYVAITLNYCFPSIHVLSSIRR
jgi:predicted SprT family Zn-dependent metalloprotease